MQLLTNIKFGEVNNLSDARYAAGTGAEFLGFNFSPSNPRYISPTAALEIKGWVDGPKLVAEWDDVPVDVIKDMAERLEFSYVQLNCLNPSQAEELKDLNVIQRIIITPFDDIASIIDKLDKVKTSLKYILIGCESNECEKDFLEKDSHKFMVKELCKDYPVILDLNFTKNNVLDLVNEYKPFAINLKGGNEVKPGIKDFDELSEIITQLEIHP